MSDRDLDLDFSEETLLRARWRLRSIVGISDQVRAAIRVSGVCSSDDCSPDPILQPEIPTPTSIEDGQITLDSLQLHWFRNERFDLAVGRMETKFVARGGVFSKSLDRNDSNNLRVNWTDVMHATFKAANNFL